MDFVGTLLIEILGRSEFALRQGFGCAKTLGPASARNSVDLPKEVLRI